MYCIHLWLLADRNPLVTFRLLQSTVHRALVEYVFWKCFWNFPSVNSVLFSVASISHAFIFCALLIEVVLFFSHLFHSNLLWFWFKGFLRFPVNFSLALFLIELFFFPFPPVLYFNIVFRFQPYPPCFWQVHHWWWIWHASEGWWP